MTPKRLTEIKSSMAHHGKTCPCIGHGLITRIESLTETLEKLGNPPPDELPGEIIRKALRGL